jgi:hypothetical protein
MAKDTKPTKLTLRAYQVGFGDCFLLTFHYPVTDRHVLIDFGSTGTPKNVGAGMMMRVAQDIELQCGGKLHAVVATHRHKDHISGFATSKSKGTGDIIARCEPDVVIQPWTEDPKAQPDAEKSTTVSAARKSFTATLQNMHQVAASVLAESQRMAHQPGFRAVAQQLNFLGDDNLSNRSAIENLMTMGKKNFYVHYGTKSGLERVLPGVKTYVLGPPDLTQTETIRKQRSKDAEEFWMLQALAGQHATGVGAPIFPHARSHPGNQTPPHTRWFVRHLHEIRGEQLLGLVRVLDQAMNNTSVILMFEVGGKRFLFPGDAQIENWSYALDSAKDRAAMRRRLKQVDVYKVGHHGSRNATPKSLWNLFEKRAAKPSAKRLHTVMSTMSGKHGDTTATKVPRETLVQALKAESEFFSTQQLKGSTRFREDLEFEL